VTRAGPRCGVFKRPEPPLGSMLRLVVLLATLVLAGCAAPVEDAATQDNVTPEPARPMLVFEPGWNESSDAAAPAERNESVEAAAGADDGDGEDGEDGEDGADCDNSTYVDVSNPGASCA
jgi:hypothetical protein